MSYGRPSNKSAAVDSWTSAMATIATRTTGAQRSSWLATVCLDAIFSFWKGTIRGFMRCPRTGRASLDYALFRQGGHSAQPGHGASAWPPACIPACHPDRIGYANRILDAFSYQGSSDGVLTRVGYAPTSQKKDPNIFCAEPILYPSIETEGATCEQFHAQRQWENHRNIGSRRSATPPA
jgi:hypothetical protein